MVFVTENDQTISSITKIQGTNLKLRLNADSLQTRLKDENCPKLVKKRGRIFKRLTQKWIPLFLWILIPKSWTRRCIKTDTQRFPSKYRNKTSFIELKVSFSHFWKGALEAVCWMNFVYACDYCSKLQSLKTIFHHKNQNISSLFNKISGYSLVWEF